MNDTNREEILKLFRAVLDATPPGEYIKFADAARACGWLPVQVRAMIATYADFPDVLHKQAPRGGYQLTLEEYKELEAYLDMRRAEVPTTVIAREYGITFPQIMELCPQLGVPMPHQRLTKGRDPTVRSQGRRWYWFGEDYPDIGRAFAQWAAERGGEK